MFEAGALSKQLISGLVPVLCGISRLDFVKSPLSQFQNAEFNNQDMFNVVRSVNSKSSRPLGEDLVKRSFEKWWPELETKVNQVELDAGIDTGYGIKDDNSRLEKIESAIESILSGLQNLSHRIEVSTTDRAKFSTKASDLTGLGSVFALGTSSVTKALSDAMSSRSPSVNRALAEALLKGSIRNNSYDSNLDLNNFKIISEKNNEEPS